MERFEKSWILIDTNLLIEILKDTDQKHFGDFLGELRELKITPVIERSVLFEFRRGSRTKKHLDGKNTFLEILLGEERNRFYLPSSNSAEIAENAEKLAVLYSHHDPKLSRISFVDCLVAAQLMKYEKMCLATLDNADYPLIIFDRHKVYTIDTEKEIHNIGIYTFNKMKYEKCREAFEKS